MAVQCILGNVPIKIQRFNYWNLYLHRGFNKTARRKAVVKRGMERWIKGESKAVGVKGSGCEWVGVHRWVRMDQNKLERIRIDYNGLK